MSENRVIVVAGPSGAGKDTLLGIAMSEVEGVYLAVSATTRSPREGEIDGRDYHFMSDARFGELVDKGEFLEWEDVYGRKYGTLRSEVDRARRAGMDILLELDVKGALRVRSLEKDAVLVFIRPPDFDELRKRLEKRKTEKERDIDSRLEVARREIETGEREFDLVIVNDDLQRAAEELKEVLRGKRP